MAALGISDPVIAITQPEVPTSKGRTPSNRARLESDEFYPANTVERIERRSLPDKFRVGQPVRFPSSAVCEAPTGSRLIRCETLNSGASSRHRLILDDGDGSPPVAVWETEHPFEVVWNLEGDKLAITHWTSERTSEIRVLFVSYRKTYALPHLHPDDLASLLSNIQLRGVWMYRVVGWAPYSALVVRGAGFDPSGRGFGSEVRVDMMKGSDPSYPAQLLRAYLCRKN